MASIASARMVNGARATATAADASTLHFHRKVDAQLWLDSVAGAVVTGTYTDPTAGAITLGEWAQRWYDGLGHLKPTTHYRYGSILRCQVLPEFGTVPIRDIGHEDVVIWVGDLQNRGLAGATVRQVHRVLALMLALAVRARRIPYNPAEGVKLPRAVGTEKRFLTAGQVEDLAEAAGEHGTAIRVLGYCGLRYGELAALRVRRIDLMRRRITVSESVSEVGGRAAFGTPKSHQQRSGPVPRSLIDELTVLVAGKARR